MAYAVWAWGRSGKANQQAAVMLYVHGQMGDARPGEVDPDGVSAAVAGRLRPGRAGRCALPRALPRRRDVARPAARRRAGHGHDQGAVGLRRAAAGRRADADGRGRGHPVEGLDRRRRRRQRPVHATQRRRRDDHGEDGADRLDAAARLRADRPGRRHERPAAGRARLADPHRLGEDGRVQGAGAGRVDLRSGRDHARRHGRATR